MSDSFRDPHHVAKLAETEALSVAALGRRAGARVAEILTNTITDLETNRSRMRYEEHRKQGLPITTAWMESVVKVMNYRVKGTEIS